MIQIEKDDGVAVLQMAHGKASAIDLELFTTLDEKLAEVAQDEDVRAAVITGTGKIFSAGVDLFRVLKEGDDYLDAFVPAVAGVPGRVATTPIPVVAAINGHAIAGGCILACACDRRVMSDHERARIGVSELSVGVPFPVAALELLRAVVPEHHTQDLVYGARTLAPQDALRIGLVDELATPESVLEVAVQAARRLGQIPRRAFALTKRQLREPMLERIRRLSPALDPEIIEVWKDQQTQEGIRAFMEKIGK